MSSETSTDASAPRLPSGQAHRDQLQPWQLFTLAGLAAATGVVFLEVFVWGADRITAILLSVVVAAAAIAGLAAYRAFAPLAGADDVSGSDIISGRTRAAMEREKALALKTIKELEFDRSMGKLSEKDFTEMGARLRTRAAGLMRQLDQETASYREQIEKELSRRIGAAPPAAKGACAACGTTNDPDAKFCKSCGAKVE